AVGPVDGGVVLGAADNAAGVAALLELARTSVEHRPARSLLFAAFGAEEWGLHGSRALAARLAAFPGRPVAMLNLDSLGTAPAGEVRVLGGSISPGLRALAEPAARGAGVTIGKDVDAYAYRWGSDFWSFHEKG